MKILKGIGVVVVILLAVYLTLCIFGPATFSVERSIMIDQKPEVVFNEINTLKQWQMWSYWDNIDPNMKSTYEGPESGVGAVHKWTSENDSVGNGTLAIRTSTPNTLIECDLTFEGMGTSTSGWALKDTAGGTMVKAYMNGGSPFFMRAMMLFMDMDAMLGADFEKTLAGLKKHTESLQSAMVFDYKIEISKTPACKLMCIADSGTTADISAKLGELYGEIGAEMSKQGLKQAGAPLAIYDKVEYLESGEMKFWFRAGVQVDKPGKSAGRVVYSDNPAQDAVKCNYYGDYSKIEAAHAAIDEYMGTNSILPKGPAWEIYITDPGTEPDPSKWLTEVYYPF